MPRQPSAAARPAAAPGAASPVSRPDDNAQTAPGTPGLGLVIGHRDAGDPLCVLEVAAPQEPACRSLGCGDVGALAGGGPGRYDANVRSTTATPKIDHASPVPLHEQVAAAIRRAIADGEARAGERLPPAKDLAAVLGVNANTVFRGLRTLREEGLVEFRRGRGVSVTGIGPQRSVVVAKARELVAVARRYGYRPEELTAIIEQVSVELP